MDEFAQLLFFHNGKKYKVAMPDLFPVNPLVFNMSSKVHEYLKIIADEQPIKYIVDVGACIGACSVPYSIIFPEASILCIEPSKYNYPFLEFNIKELPQVKALKIAANDVSKTVRISSPSMLQLDSVRKPHTGLISMYGQDPKYAENVNSDTLDNIVKSRVDWLKIDVEGNERNVLVGAKRILSEDKPILQIEFKEDNLRMAKTSSAALLLDILKYNYTPVGAIRGDLIFWPRT